MYEYLQNSFIMINAPGFLSDALSFLSYFDEFLRVLKTYAHQIFSFSLFFFSGFFFLRVYLEFLSIHLESLYKNESLVISHDGSTTLSLTQELPDTEYLDDILYLMF